MTIDEFNQKWGGQWSAFKKHEMFKDAMNTLLCTSPATDAHKLTFEAIDKYTPAFLGSVSGYSLCMSMLREKFGDVVIQPEEESYFNISLEEQIAGISTDQNQ